LVDAVQRAIGSADPDALQTAHGSDETSALDDFDHADWITLNNVYSQTDVYERSIAQYDKGNVPFFLIESYYENEHDLTTADVRNQAYSAMLAGAFGQVFGNNPMWHFDGPGLFDTGTTWQEELDSPGARSMTVLARVFAAFEWWRLRPSPSGELAAGSADAPVRAAIADDASFAVVYVPDSGSVTLDLAALQSPRVRLSWIDPSDGAVSASETVAADDGPVERSIDRDTADGERDWLLLLQPMS
jgi:hypothetical protein